MAGSLNVSLKVVRFLPGKEAIDVIAIEEEVESENQRLVDDMYLNELRFMTMCNSFITCGKVGEWWGWDYHHNKRSR
jgi:hypothetical protein